MAFDASQIVTGLEDDDNFYELVRQFGGLRTQQDAIILSRFVVGEIAQRLPVELRRGLEGELPQQLRDQIAENVFSLREATLAGIEHEVQRKWRVEIDAAARMAGAVGLALSDRLPPPILEKVKAALPIDVRALFAER